MRRTRILFCCISLVLLSGCYEQRVKEVVSKLQIGMSREEVKTITSRIKFLATQKVARYPNATDNQIRGDLYNLNKTQSIYPSNLMDEISLDGNILALSYLIHWENIKGNPPVIDYLAIFIDQNQDKVIGWGHFRTMGEPRVWGDKF